MLRMQEVGKPMNIESKFNIGDIIYRTRIRENFKPVRTCPVCCGSGKSILAPGKPCDLTLNGCRCRDGVLHERCVEYIPCKSKIVGIVTRTVRSGRGTKTRIEYMYDGIKEKYGPAFVREDYVFSTEEECQKFCDSKNAEK